MKSDKVCNKCNSIKYYAKGLCKSCYRKQLIPNKWSKKYNQCINCGTSERPHVGHGLCGKCGSNKVGTEKLCECGCGKYTSVHRGKPKRFLQGHWVRTVASSDEWKLMLHNKYAGENNPCYGLYGENHPAFNHFTSEELRETRRQTRLKTMANPQNKRTSIEIILHTLLEELSIQHIPQYIIGGKFSVDEFIPQCNIIIEAYGDFWHSNPIKYEEKPLTIVQKKIRTKDNSKIKYLEACGYKILILWETELKLYPQECKHKILEIIKNQFIPQL